jgi:hypothetical protein
MRTLGHVLLALSAVALIAFPFCYHLTTRGHWRDTIMGWHLMSFMAVLGLVMTFALLNLVIELPGWVRPLTWLLVAGVAWWRLILLFVVQLRDDEDDASGH